MMNREIKFRAWDKKRNQLTFIKRIEFDVIGDGINLFSTSGEQFDGILNQYTGLKDKNGVEIYEGDIVKWKASYINDDSEEFTMEVKRLESGLYVPHINPTSEVIGNIYENKELLK